MSWNTTPATLPKLAYAYTALEPAISGTIMASCSSSPSRMTRPLYSPPTVSAGAPPLQAPRYLCCQLQQGPSSSLSCCYEPNSGEQLPDLGLFLPLLPPFCDPPYPVLCILTIAPVVLLPSHRLVALLPRLGRRGPPGRFPGCRHQEADRSPGCHQVQRWWCVSRASLLLATFRTELVFFPSSGHINHVRPPLPLLLLLLHYC